MRNRNQVFFFICSLLFTACDITNQSRAKHRADMDSNIEFSNEETGIITNPPLSALPSGSTSETGTISYIREGKEIKSQLYSIISIDNQEISPGNKYLATLSANSRVNNANETIHLCFVFCFEKGTYPLVRYSFEREFNQDKQVFGNILSVLEQISPYKVYITECMNIRDHLWKLSGFIEQSIMISSEKAGQQNKNDHNFPKIEISDIKFRDVLFIDNFEEIMHNISKQNKKP